MPPLTGKSNQYQDFPLLNCTAFSLRGSVIQGKTGGVHFSYLDSFIQKTPGSYAVGNLFTIADAALFSLMQVMQMPQVALADKLNASYPDLMAYTMQIAELPALKSYITSS